MEGCCRCRGCGRDLAAPGRSELVPGLPPSAHDLSLATRADDSGRDLYTIYTIARLPQTSIGRAVVSIYKEKHNYMSSYSPT